MKDSHVLLYRASDKAEAHLLAHAIESAGMRAVVSGGDALVLGAAGEPYTEVWVAAEDLERARAAVERYLRKQGRDRAG